jgi:hypothetical protein
VATKRLTIELPLEQYEVVRKQAQATGTTVSGYIRRLINEVRFRLPREARRNYRDDSLHKRRGSFEGPSNLAETHDKYLYGKTPK